MQIKNHSVVGMFAGDEGKGKITDLLSSEVEVVVRAEGGANAGHTIQTGGKSFIGHLLPSGAAAGKLCVLGRGVRIDLHQLLSEIDEFETEFGSRPKVVIDGGACLNFPWHKALEYYLEKMKGSRRAYTTMRGMCASGGTVCFRLNPRVAMLYRRDELVSLLNDFYASFAGIFQHEIFGSDEFLKIAGGPLPGPEDMADMLIADGDKIKDFVTDVRAELYEMIEQGTPVLFEGAQGIMLDPYWGTYLYNTQGICTFAGLAVGTGLPLEFLGTKHGIVKALHSRVGNGPFPTELGDDSITNQEKPIPKDEREAWLDDMLERINSGHASAQEVGQYFRIKGNEYGATSGRPRRTGWFDAAWLKYAVQVNRPDDLVLTKLDCLSGLATVRIATGYSNLEKPYEHGRIPALSSELGMLEPEYADVQGWKEDITGETDYNSLPASTRNYIEIIEQMVGVRFRYIGTGPDREHIIVRD